MRIEVRGGTVDHGQWSLCETCRWSTIIRGTKLGDEIVECNQLSYRNQRIPFAVTSCTRYSNRNQVGFVRSSRLTDEERYVLEED